MSGVGMAGTPAERAIVDLAGNFRRHLDDDRRAFGEVKEAVADVGRKVDTASSALQARLATLETDRIRRDAVNEYRVAEAREAIESKNVRQNLGLSRRAWWLSVAVAVFTLAGVTAAWLSILVH